MFVCLHLRVCMCRQIVCVYEIMHVYIYVCV
uniref:Uncharacterized protein n=1 Tax=Anguilla anguilla TaxID=7936 RepID=A0A0E9QT90_ANGAN